MDLVQEIQSKLHELRTIRAEQDKVYQGEEDPQSMVNGIIADTMNRLETLFVMFNLPADGFVSLTPRSQQNDEEASPS